MKDSNLILETAVINTYEKLTKTEGYKAATMKFEEVQKAIVDDENWNYLKELQFELVKVMYELGKMKDFIEFIHKNDYE